MSGSLSSAGECFVDVDSALRQMPQLSAWMIEWQLQNGTLVLRGRVRSFYQKQLAQTAARRLRGVDQVINEIEVEQHVVGCRPHDEREH
mgnify:CR=1 FL=1